MCILFFGSRPISLNQAFNPGPHSFIDSHLTTPLPQIFFPQKSVHEHPILNQSKKIKIIHLIYDKLLTFGEYFIWLTITVKHNFKLPGANCHPLILKLIFDRYPLYDVKKIKNRIASGRQESQTKNILLRSNALSVMCHAAIRQPVQSSTECVITYVNETPNQH